MMTNFPREEALAQHMVCIFTAVCHLHKLGFVHRNIRPEVFFQSQDPHRRLLLAGHEYNYINQQSKFQFQHSGQYIHNQGLQKARRQQAAGLERSCRYHYGLAGRRQRLWVEDEGAQESEGARGRFRQELELQPNHSRHGENDQAGGWVENLSGGSQTDVRGLHRLHQGRVQSVVLSRDCFYLSISYV